MVAKDPFCGAHVLGTTCLKILDVCDTQCGVTRSKRDFKETKIEDTTSGIDTDGSETEVLEANGRRSRASRARSSALTDTDTDSESSNGGSSAQYNGPR